MWSAKGKHEKYLYMHILWFNTVAMTAAKQICEQNKIDVPYMCMCWTEKKNVLTVSFFKIFMIHIC